MRLLKPFSFLTFLFLSLIAVQVKAENLGSGADNIALSLSNFSKNEENFIQGFIVGALLTDYAIIEKMGNQSSFSERAYKTRVARGNRSATAMAGFCLPEKLTVKQIAHSVKNSLKKEMKSPEEYGQRVYRALKKNFPC